MFKTGTPLPLKVVSKLLQALKGYRLSFYDLDDRGLTIFVVNDKTRVKLTKLLVGPQDNQRIFLGHFKYGDIARRTKCNDSRSKT